MVAPWPEPQGTETDTKAEEAMQTIMDVIDGIRSVRGEMNVPPSSEVEIRIQAPNPETAELLSEHLEEYLPAFTRFSQISIATHQEKPAAAAVAVISDIVIYIPLAGIIDIEKERDRLRKRLDKVLKELTGTQKTLDNPKFVDRAPEAVVNQKRARLATLKSEQEKLVTNIEMLG